MDDKEKQEISIIGRLLSMEALILLMGLISLGYGIRTGQAINIFWGVTILIGAVTLSFVRKKDWKKHWEEQEALRQNYERRLKEKKESEDAGKR